MIIFLVKEPLPPPELSENVSWYKVAYNARPFLIKAKFFN